MRRKFLELRKFISHKKKGGSIIEDDNPPAEAMFRIWFNYTQKKEYIRTFIDF